MEILNQIVQNNNMVFGLWVVLDELLS